jgi:hypothetical protein
MIRRRALWADFRLAWQTLVVVAALVGVRAVLFSWGFQGLPLTALAGSIIAGGVFVMGLVVAGTMSDYKEAERAPSDLAAALYALLRDSEAISRAWGRVDLPTLRHRLVAVVDGLRRDIDAGDSREAQAAVEALSDSFAEMENTDVPDSRVAHLRLLQSELRKAVLRIYHLQREEFLPSAWVMINSFVVLILGMLMVSSLDSAVETLVTLGFFTFFFIYLLRLLAVIDKPFKVGERRSDDDVSLFLLYEFVVHAQAGDTPINTERVVEIAEQVERVEGGEEEAVKDSAGRPVADLRADSGDLADLADVVAAVSRQN